MTATAAQQTVRVYQLKIVLRDISPLIWRRVRVTSDTTIADLHAIVQTVVGWEDLHLHQFRIHGKAYGVNRGGGLTFADDPRQVRLADFRLHTGERFLYEYDFGDGCNTTSGSKRSCCSMSRRTIPFAQRDMATARRRSAVVPAGMPRCSGSAVPGGP